MTLKSVLTGRDAHAIIGAAETGEDSAVRAYDNALRVHLPAEIQGLLEAQASRVREAHDRVRQLRERPAA
jgi:uncharacterized protein (TIGR02284 family)